MSDPVTNIEIEDVLSSIRRLVSEGDRPRPESRAGAAAAPELARTVRRVPSENPSGSEKLSGDRRGTAPVDADAPVDDATVDAGRFVLTPSLRIDDPASVQARDTAPPPRGTSGPLVLTQPANIPPANSPKLPPAGADTVNGTHPTNIFAGRLFDKDLARKAAAVQHAVTAHLQSAPEDPATTAVLHDDAMDSADDRLTDHLQPEVDTTNSADRMADAAAVRPSGATPVLVTDTDNDTDNDTDAGPNGDTDGPESPKTARNEAPIDPAALARAAGRASLEGKIAELEAAITHQTDDWEPDGSEGTPVVDWASSAAQAGVFASRMRRSATVEDAEELPPHTTATDPADEAGAASQSLGEGTPDDAAATFDADSIAASIFGDDAVIDEAVLRELVADIVRQELQGKLGERITRNVRKLVRREIYRVISSESFD